MRNPEDYTKIRRKERGKDTAWIKAFLARAEFGTMATIKGDQPFLVTRNFAYDEATHAIYMHGAKKGRTYDSAMEAPRVCFSNSEAGRLLRFTDLHPFMLSQVAAALQHPTELNRPHRRGVTIVQHDLTLLLGPAEIDGSGRRSRRRGWVIGTPIGMSAQHIEGILCPLFVHSAQEREIGRHLDGTVELTREGQVCRRFPSRCQTGTDDDGLRITRFDAFVGSAQQCRIVCRVWLSSPLVV